MMILVFIFIENYSWDFYSLIALWFYTVKSRIKAASGLQKVLSTEIFLLRISVAGTYNFTKNERVVMYSI